MDKYEQRELLGHGNSAVYRAIRLADGASVALKRVRGWAALPPAEQATALREMAALKAVDHPHAIKLLDSFSDKGDLCLVLPLVAPGARVFEGSALPLSPAAVAKVGFQVLGALAHLHGLSPPLLHRDVKPANWLLQAAQEAALPPPGALTPELASSLVLGGKVILADFGSAQLLARTQATGTRAGTDAFKSPEVLDLEDYDASADVWACGASLLHLATGHLAGGTLAAQRNIKRRLWTLQEALAGAYPEGAGDEAVWGAKCEAQRAAWGALGEPLQNLIGQCLKLEPGERSSAGALLGHVAFERERRTALVASAVQKLEQSGGDATPEELLAVLEAGAAVREAVFVQACEAVEGLPAAAAGEALCSALLAALRSGRESAVAPAARALKALLDKGSAPALAAASAGAAELLGAVASGMAAKASLRRDVASLTAQLRSASADAVNLRMQSQACDLEKARLSECNAELRSQADRLSAEAVAMRGSLAREQATSAELQAKVAPLAAGNAHLLTQYEELRVKFNQIAVRNPQLEARNAQLEAYLARFSGLDNYCLAIQKNGDVCINSPQSGRFRCGKH